MKRKTYRFSLKKNGVRDIAQFGQCEYDKTSFFTRHTFLVKYKTNHMFKVEIFLEQRWRLRSYHPAKFEKI